MSDYQRQQTGSNNWTNQHREPNDSCAPGGPPADQPKDPCGKCEPLPTTEPPHLEEPEKCPDPPCCCPEPPHPPPPSCLDELIKHQQHEIDEATHAATIKADLQALLDKANAAKKEYTSDKYTQLVKDWKAIDADIAEVIRKLVCAVPCWWCLIECHICPLLYAIRYREQKLYGEWKMYDEVHSLYDLQYWHLHDKRRKQAMYDRVQAVLAAWETPAQTIEAAIAANRDLVKSAQSVLNPDAPKLVFDVFLRLLPLHLAIAPPADSGVVTVIAKEYTEFCKCDTGDPDDCCGPDVGVPTVRQRLIGPKPYLVRPNQLLPIICCLTKERYLPASAALARATANAKKVDDEVTKYEGEIVSLMASLPADAKAALPAPVDCCKYTTSDRKNSSDSNAQTAR